MLHSAELRADLDRVECLAVQPIRHVPTLAEDARAGLLARPRSLPPKYFYDARGSHLFELICRTPEYYPTRTEIALLQQHAREVIRVVRPDHLIELGSGSSRKTRILLEACVAERCFCEYWPMDVCQSMLLRAATQLSEEHEWLAVHALSGDYCGGLGNLPLPNEGQRLFVFLGGTIGNFDHDEAAALIDEIAGLMRPGDAFLLGADRVKNPRVLHAAYNDAAGVTAAFNRNVLNVLNRELRGDFRVEQFRHAAAYNEAASQIEMYLVADQSQQVRFDVLDAVIAFEEGEPMLTEISRKFSVESLERLLAGAGLESTAHFEPRDQYFSLLLATKNGRRLS